MWRSRTAEGRGRRTHQEPSSDPTRIRSPDVSPRSDSLPGTEPQTRAPCQSICRNRRHRGGGDCGSGSAVGAAPGTCMTIGLGGCAARCSSNLSKRALAAEAVSAWRSRKRSKRVFMPTIWPLIPFSIQPMKTRPMVRMMPKAHYIARRLSLKPSMRLLRPSTAFSKVPIRASNWVTRLTKSSISGGLGGGG